MSHLSGSDWQISLEMEKPMLLESTRKTVYIILVVTCSRKESTPRSVVAL